MDYISLQVNNFAGVESEGIDFNMTYVLDTEKFGRFDFGLEAAKYTKYIVQSYPESPLIEYQGQLGLPSLRMNPHIYWGKGDWGAALTGYYIDGQNEDIGSTNYRIGSHIRIRSTGILSAPLGCFDRQLVPLTYWMKIPRLMVMYTVGILLIILFMM